MPSRLLLVVVPLLMAAGQPAVTTPPRPASAVDLRKYAGTYYEIARFPNGFQKQCSGDVTATYAIRSDRRIDIVNRCRKPDGAIDEARGIAKPAGQDGSNGRLRVRFAPGWLSLLPRVWGEYWILGVGPEDSYAVVGDPARNYLWILSRLARMPDMQYRQALEIARSNGYDIATLVKTPQGQQ